MHVVLLSTGADTAGVGFRTAQALRRYAPDDVEARQVAAAGRRGRYLDYPQDVVYESKLEAQQWYGWADVVHLANTLHAWDWWDRGRLRKRLVLHHHGSEYRTGHRELAARARAIGAVQVVATVDLLGLEDDVTTWLPAAYRGVDLQAWRAKGRRPDDGQVVVAHAPTDRAVKGTDDVLAAVAQLQAEGLPVVLDLIEGVSWRQCMARKARADVVVDQLVLGYGCNAVEAWGMGLPVVAGVQDAGVRERMLGLWGELPFADGTGGALLPTLRTLVLSPLARTTWAARGMAHFDAYHDEARVVPLLLDVYAATRPAARRLVLQEVG